jgi:hypothetical protein
MQHSLTAGQAEVLKAFLDHGPMHDAELATFVHHHSPLTMSSSGIRTRRAELARLDPPLLQAVGVRPMKSGRHSAVHGLTAAGKTAAESLYAAVAA